MRQTWASPAGKSQLSTVQCTHFSSLPDELPPRWNREARIIYRKICVAVAGGQDCCCCWLMILRRSKQQSTGLCGKDLGFEMILQDPGREDQETFLLLLLVTPFQKRLALSVLINRSHINDSRGCKKHSVLKYVFSGTNETMFRLDMLSTKLLILCTRVHYIQYFFPTKKQTKLH